MRPVNAAAQLPAVRQDAKRRQVRENSGTPRTPAKDSVLCTPVWRNGLSGLSKSLQSKMEIKEWCILKHPNLWKMWETQGQ